MTFASAFWRLWYAAMVVVIIGHVAVGAHIGWSICAAIVAACALLFAADADECPA